MIPISDVSILFVIFISLNNVLRNLIISIEVVLLDFKYHSEVPFDAIAEIILIEFTKWMFLIEHDRPRFNHE